LEGGAGTSLKEAANGVADFSQLPTRDQSLSGSCQGSLAEEVVGRENLTTLLCFSLVRESSPTTVKI